MKKKTPLYLAACKHKHAILSVLLQQKADPNICDKAGNSPLHLVCKNFKNMKSIKLLLDYGAKASLKNKAGFSPLAEMLPGVLQRTKTEFDQLCELMKLLMQHGAKDQFRYEFGFDDFVTYGEPEHVKVLIEAGASLESRCHKHTPLLRAASLGKTAMVKILVQKGADIHAITTDHGESALHLAAKEGYLETVKVLLAYGADPNREKSPLNPRFAQNRAWLTVFSKSTFSTNAKPEQYETPLHFAARDGRAEVVLLLVQAGANLNQASRSGTPLHCAISGIEWASFNTHNPDYVKTVKILLQLGADSRAQYAESAEKSGLTPLQYAEAQLSSLNQKEKKIMQEIIALLRSCENTENKKRIPTLCLNKDSNF